MSIPTQWTLRGLFVGISMTALILLATILKVLFNGGSWELVGWAGIWAYLAAFPASLFLGSVAGSGNYLVILFAPSVNWALLGFVLGSILSVLAREPKTKNIDD